MAANILKQLEDDSRNLSTELFNVEETYKADLSKINSQIQSIRMPVKPEVKKNFIRIPYKE